VTSKTWQLTAVLQEQSSVDEHHADDVAGAVESVPKGKLKKLSVDEQ
jgi:hypothetical protein